MGLATTFTELVAKANSEKVFLAEVQPAEFLSGWILSSGQTYTYEISFLYELITYANNNYLKYIDSTEIVSNGGFPSDTDDWTEQNSASLASVAGGKVGNCLEVTENGAANPGAWQTMEVIPGEEYQIEGYIKAGTEATYMISLLNNITQASIWNSGSNEETAGDWSTNFTHTFTAPEGCIEVKLFLYQICASAAGTTILFDSISLRWVARAGEKLRKEIIKLTEDGVELDVLGSISAVEGASGSYWHDTDNEMLYVHPSGDNSPINYTMMGFFWLRFATKGIQLGDYYFEPYISEKGVPSLSVKNNNIHWGVSNIGLGVLQLSNSNGYFDQISKRFVWTNKLIKLLLGGESLPYTEYEVLFTGRVRDKKCNQRTFSLKLKSMAFDLLRKLPVNDFTISDYPNLEDGIEGNPIPYYYGSYNSLQAPVVWCINTSYGSDVYQFKICDHPIWSITQVYIDYDDGDGWQTISHANEDLINATFTIYSTTFVVGTSKVKVSFEGRYGGGDHGEQMLTDGGLENWTGDVPDDWVIFVEGSGSAIEDETTIVHGGTHSCKCTMGTDLGWWIQELLDFWPGYNYKVTLWLYGNGSNSIRIIDYYSTPGGLDENVIPPATWTQYSFTWTANYYSDRLKIIRANPAETSWSCYIDDVRVELVATADDMIEDAPTIAEDILVKLCGYDYDDLDITSFDQSKEITEMTLNVPLEVETSALKIIERLCASDLAFFDEDGDGKLRYRTWIPEIGTPPELDGTDILGKPIPSVIDDVVSLYWKIKVGYSYLCEPQRYMYYPESNESSRHKYEKEETLTHNSYVRTQTDASRLGQRLLMVLQDPSPLLSIRLKATQILKTLGDKLKITLARASVTTAGGYSKRPFEIFHITKMFFPLRVAIKARDLPDYSSNIGFWTDDSASNYDVAPDEEKESSGYWTDDDGFAEPGNSNSLNVSRWW